MNSAIKIRIETVNNSDARNFRVLDPIGRNVSRHNGGKVVIATFDESRLSQAEALLDESHVVASYTVEVSK